MSRVPITEDQVGGAFRAVFECLALVEEHITFCVGLQGKHPLSTPSKPIDLSTEDAGSIVQGLRRLLEVVERAEGLPAPLGK